MARRISTGGVNRTANSDYDLTHWAAHGEASYVVWRGAHTVVEPQIGVSFVSIDRGNAIEQGADDLNLSVAGDSIDELSGEIGLRWAGSFSGASGAVWMPELSLGWRERFTDADRRAVARFTNAGGSSFSVQGAKIEKGYPWLNAGLTAALPNGARLFLHYDGVFGSNTRADTGTAGVEWSF